MLGKGCGFRGRCAPRCSEYPIMFPVQTGLSLPFETQRQQLRKPLIGYEVLRWAVRKLRHPAISSLLPVYSFPCGW